jgi:hypothetical protein
MFLRGMITAVALALFAFGAPAAKAQAIGFADAYDRIARDCGTDVERYCSSVELGKGAVKACLEKNAAKLSPQCKAGMPKTFAALQQRINAQANVRKVCDRDARQYCRGVQPHDGYQIQCLIGASTVVSASCKQIIVDAGWN